MHIKNRREKSAKRVTECDDPPAPFPTLLYFLSNKKKHTFNAHFSLKRLQIKLQTQEKQQ